MVEREEKIMDALEIRDTDEHFSSSSDTTDIINKTFFIENSLNKDCDTTVQASRDSAFTFPIDVGNTITVKSGEERVMLQSNYFPFVRVKVEVFGASPSSGSVTIYIEKRLAI